MTQRKELSLGAVVVCAVAVVTWGAASAAPAAKASKRDQAIAECVALAKASAPRDQILGGGAADPGGAAMVVYKSCMQKKGLRP
jgi:hypothetical protein